MPRPVRPSEATIEGSQRSEASPAWLFFIGMLLAARYLQPTEAASFGETLWQSQLWLCGAAIWCWLSLRSGDRTLAWSPLDAFLGLIFVGHVLSTIPVFLEGGDRRAALNLVWEWAGLLAMLFLVRQVLFGRDRRPVAGFVSVVVGIAALGIWQHHVSFPETARQYDELTSSEARLAAHVASGDASASERSQLEEVRRKLADFGIPTESSARRKWENRVKFSSESFGTFGLANTLGGLLAAAIPILIVDLRSHQRKWSLAGAIAALGIVFYCLLLTKSRTAWVGLAVGGIAGLGVLLLKGRIDRKMIAGAGAILVLGVFAGAGLVAAGSLDREVVSEAPKSLQYRLDYWTGTLHVLRDRPLFGTGPAQFRSYYLEHRPVGASEEIAAPHNLFLEIWTAGGLVSVLALGGLILYTVGGWLKDRPTEDRGVTPPDPSSGMSPFLLGTLAAFPITFLLYFVSGAGLDWRILTMVAVVAVAAVCQSGSNSHRLAHVGVGAAFLALIIHLLGADGIEFPAVVQTLLVTALFLDSRHWSAPPKTSTIVTMAGFTVLALGCFMTGLQPVLNSGAFTSRAEAALVRGDAGVDRLLTEGIDADPLSLKARRLQAELATSRAKASQRQSEILQSRRLWESYLQLDPRSVLARRSLANLLLSTRDGVLARDAADYLEAAVALSPTDIDLRVEMARAAQAAGDRTMAASQANRALELDRINRAARHFDITLDDDTLSELQLLSAVGMRSRAP